MNTRGRSRSIGAGAILSIGTIFAISHIACERKSNPVRDEKRENPRSFLDRSRKTPRDLSFYELALTLTKRLSRARRTHRNAQSERIASRRRVSDPCAFSTLAVVTCEVHSVKSDYSHISRLNAEEPNRSLPHSTKPPLKRGADAFGRQIYQAGHSSP